MVEYVRYHFKGLYGVHIEIIDQFHVLYNAGGVHGIQLIMTKDLSRFQ